MTEFRENIIMLSYSLYTLAQYQDKKEFTVYDCQEIEWLKGKSIYGIELYLVEAEKMGFVASVWKNNEFYYRGTAKGNKAYEKHFGS